MTVSDWVQAAGIAVVIFALWGLLHEPGSIEPRDRFPFF